ncbi:hypothetical protein N9D31_00085 [Oligoflexaceae bacterium]|nr:hypothetical protein [Oligoflexaceae bacterium]
MKSVNLENEIKKKEAELVRLKSKATSTSPRTKAKTKRIAHSKKTDVNLNGETEESNSEASNTEDHMLNKTEELISILKSAKGKKLLICIKGYPDPDNIATSLALHWMCQRFEIDSHIVHFEEISHHENRALVKKLDIDIEHYTEDFDTSGYDYFAINDSQNPEIPISLPETCKLLVFVDHHKSLGTVESEFLDIRENAGSTSGIYAEYLTDSRFNFTGEDSIETKIATALMHGIRSDTDNFVNATPIDYRASEFIAQFIDKDLLSLISRQSVPARTMDLTQVALQRKDIRGNFMFSGVGYVRDEDRDGIGQCADYLLHREGIDTVVVYGVVNGEFIDGSLRTKSHTLDPDKWIKDVFGKDDRGTFYGGGRKDKGGFQIPLGVFSECSDKELLWILIKKTIDELFYDKIGVENKSDLSALDND